MFQVHCRWTSWRRAEKNQNKYFLPRKLLICKTTHYGPLFPPTNYDDFHNNIIIITKKYYNNNNRSYIIIVLLSQ